MIKTLIKQNAERNIVVSGFLVRICTSTFFSMKMSKGEKAEEGTGIKTDRRFVFT